MDKTISDLTKEIAKLKEIVHIIYLRKATPVTKARPKAMAKFIDIKEASKVLNLAIPTIYSKVSRNELPYYKIDGSKKLYFLKSELEEYINSSRMATEAELINNRLNLN